MLHVPVLTIAENQNLADQLKEWIMIHCLKNPSWFREDKYVGINRGDVETFKKVEEWCQNQKPKVCLYYRHLPDNKWLVGVVGSV